MNHQEYLDPGFVTVPNHVFDALSSLSGSEAKILLYIVRHTCGFNECHKPKRIAQDEFMHGRKKSSRERIDGGTGLTKPTVENALRSLIKKGLIERTEDTHDLARIRRDYRLRIKTESDSHSDGASESDPTETARILITEGKNPSRVGQDINSSEDKVFALDHRDTTNTNTLRQYTTVGFPQSPNGGEVPTATPTAPSISLLNKGIKEPTVGDVFSPKYLPKYGWIPFYTESTYDFLLAKDLLHENLRNDKTKTTDMWGCELERLLKMKGVTENMVIEVLEFMQEPENWWVCNKLFKSINDLNRRNKNGFLRIISMHDSIRWRSSRSRVQSG